MKSQPDVNYKADDVVYTPRGLAKRIIEHFPIRGKVLDPCVGDGAFYDQFPEGCEKHWCEISKGLDFFAFSEHMGWCVSNPPYSIFRDFLLKPMRIADNIVYLITVNHCWTKARIRDMRENGFGMREIFCVDTPKNFPPSGFQYGAIWFQRHWEGDIKMSFDIEKVQGNLEI